MNCPIGLDKIHCPSCQFQKQGLCDYPYRSGLSYEENKEITLRNIDGGRLHEN